MKISKFSVLNLTISMGSLGLTGCNQETIVEVAPPEAIAHTVASSYHENESSEHSESAEHDHVDSDEVESTHGFLKLNWKASTRVSDSDFISAEVKVTSVRIKHSTLGWYKIPVDPFYLNLLSPVGQLDSTWFRAYVPAGAISEIRLQIEENGTALLNDQTQATLVVPSGEHSGIKVKFKKELQVHGNDLSSAQFGIDFEKSMHLKRFSNGSTKVTLLPVVWASYTAQPIDLNSQSNEQSPIEIVQDNGEATSEPTIVTDTVSTWTDPAPATTDSGGLYLSVIGI